MRQLSEKQKAHNLLKHGHVNPILIDEHCVGKVAHGTNVTNAIIDENCIEQIINSSLAFAFKPLPSSSNENLVGWLRFFLNKDGMFIKNPKSGTTPNRVPPFILLPTYREYFDPHTEVKAFTTKEVFDNVMIRYKSKNILKYGCERGFDIDIDQSMCVYEQNHVSFDDFVKFLFHYTDCTINFHKNIFTATLSSDVVIKTHNQSFQCHGGDAVYTTIPVNDPVRHVLIDKEHVLKSVLNYNFERIRFVYDHE